MKRHLFVIGGTILGTVVGSVSGYVFAIKKLEAKYASLLSEEIAITKAHYKVLYKRDEDATPESAVRSRVVENPQVEVLERLMKGLSYGASRTEELPRRVPQTPDAPYILPVEDYMNGEVGYDQRTLTYYAGDNALADEGDEIVNHDILGDCDFNNMFGDRSGDPLTVFIRNDRLGLDFEVVRDEGTYAEIVAGLST